MNVYEYTEISTCEEFHVWRYSMCVPIYMYLLLYDMSIITRKGVHKSDINYRENMETGQ